MDDASYGRRHSKVWLPALCGAQLAPVIFCEKSGANRLDCRLRCVDPCRRITNDVLTITFSLVAIPTLGHARGPKDKRVLVLAS